MNALIEKIFSNFIVGDKVIPVSFLRYEGHEDAYVTYQKIDSDYTLICDDELMLYVDFYDFDIYSKGNYTNIIRNIKEILKENGFIWQPARSSADMYEDDTGYYHITLNFAIFREEK